MGAASYETEPLGPNDAKCGFDCGKAPLNDYLAKYAGQNQRSGVSRTWVLRRGPNQDQLPLVLGYYTLALSTLTREDLPTEDARRKLPRYPLPVALIARLARDRRANGLRLGERLLVDAHARVVAITAQAGCVGIVVDAKDADAARFYAHYGYAPIVLAGEQDKWPRRMFIPIATVTAAAPS